MQYKIWRIENPEKCCHVKTGKAIPLPLDPLIQCQRTLSVSIVNLTDLNISWLNTRLRIQVKPNEPTFFR